MNLTFPPQSCCLSYQDKKVILILLVTVSLQLIYGKYDEVGVVLFGTDGN
jgi:hypothetical protein